MRFVVRCPRLGVVRAVAPGTSGTRPPQPKGSNTHASSRARARPAAATGRGRGCRRVRPGGRRRLAGCSRRAASGHVPDRAVPRRTGRHLHHAHRRCHPVRQRPGRHNGNIIWQLGGKASSFTLRAAPGQSLNTAGDIFAWQHDPNALGHGEYTFFDNESAGLANTGSGVSSEFGFSRAVRVQLDERRRTATLVQSYDQPESLTAPSQGNAQTTSHGDLFVGWGSLPYFSEFSPSGELLLNAQFPTGVNSYRAYTFPWPVSEHSWGRHERRGHRQRR
ncbi:MAG: arylsulfotransferase family protein [Solirubrobacteraceae bacterium]